MYTEKVICNQRTEGILTALDYGNKQVRRFYINGEVWWVLCDVCSVIKLTNPSSVASGMGNHEKMTISLTSSHSQQRGGARKLILINVLGLSHLLNSSCKPEAKAFQHWIMTEVTPSTIKNGGYIIGQNSMDAAELVRAADIVVRNILAEQDQQIQNLRLENAEQAALICEYEPKARYYDAVLSSQGAIAVSVIAKDYGRSAQWLNKCLYEKGVQYKRNGTWLLYQPYAKEGYTRSLPILCGSPYCKRLTYWTQKGCVFIYNLLKVNGILPLNERMDDSRDINDVEPPQIRYDWW